MCEEFHRLFRGLARQGPSGCAGTELALQLGGTQRVTRVAMRRHSAGLAHGAIAQENAHRAGLHRVTNRTAGGLRWVEQHVGSGQQVEHLRPGNGMRREARRGQRAIMQRGSQAIRQAEPRLRHAGWQQKLAMAISETSVSIRSTAPGASWSESSASTGRCVLAQHG